MISLWIGWPGTGKTQGMMDYVREQAHAQRFFVVDRAGEWGAQTLEGEANKRWRGKTPAIVDVPHDVELDWFDGQPDVGVFRFSYPWEPADVAQMVSAVGNAVYTDDEIDTVAVNFGWRENPLRDVVHRGRHLVNAFGEVCTAHICGAARRPQNLASDLTAIADQVFIYRVQGQLTLDRFRRDSWIEDEEWDEIRGLPNLNFKHWPSGQWMEIQDAFKG